MINDAEGDEASSGNDSDAPTTTVAKDGGHEKEIKLAK